MSVTTSDIDTLASTARQQRTASGSGHMVWRRWGSGRPVVLLHGGSGSWMHWLKTIPGLTSAGYEVWAPDMPGLGESAMPRPPLTPAHCGEVIAAGMEALSIAGREPHLVGFSFGAHVGTFAAIQLGSRLASFTLSGCAALGITHNYVDLKRANELPADISAEDMHRRNLASLMFADPSRIDATAIRIQALNIANARFRSRAFAKTDEIAVNLPRVAAPVRAIWGEKDVLATPSLEVRFDILRRGHPELLTHIVPGAGHWAMYEQADAFNAGLVGLLAGSERDVR